MADILIKGMEMPKVCAECPFHSMPELFMLETNRYSYISRCVRAPEEIEDPWREIVWQMEHKESWCPIIQLQPHGRLIDADSKTFPTPHRNPSNDYTKGWNACLRSVQLQSTIIPASEVENDKP